MMKRDKRMWNSLRNRALVVILSFAGPVSLAQPRPEGAEPVSPSVFFEAVKLFSSDSARARIDLQYRVEDKFFVALRNSDTSFPYAFRRSGEILVELTDSATGAVTRNLERVDIGADSEESVPIAKRWHEGVFSFPVRPGTYAVNFDINDLNSRRTFSDRTRTVRLEDPLAEPLAVSDPIFIERPDSAGIPGRITPVNFGGELLFGEATAILIELYRPRSDSAVAVRYSITSIQPSASEPQEISITDSVTLSPARDCQLKSEKISGSVTYTTVRNDPSGPSLVLVPFPATRLPLRSYILNLTFCQGKAVKTITKHFRAIWPEMPMSLKDVDYALDILRYITTPAVLDSLKSGNYESRRKNLEAFWKGHDQTPETAYNEVMTEYYRRVDLAMRSFGTLKVADGAKSDRGRIYILYGPPSRTRRTLDPHSAFEEVWLYERLNREFRFIDKNRNGTYEVEQPANP